MRKNLSVKNGQSMIEVVVGIAVVVVLAISLITTTLITQKTASSAKNNSQATKLAQQSIEQVRIFRDRKGFNLLPTTNGCYNLNVSDTNPSLWTFSALYDCTSGTAEPITLDNIIFSRKIQFAYVSSTQKNVVVTVTWTESAGQQSVVNTSLITSWCAGQIVAGSPCPSP